MIVTEILGNISEFAPEQRADLKQDRLPLDNLQLVKRVQRAATASGREVGLRLPPHIRELKDGDILYQDGQDVITVHVIPADVIVIRPRSIHEMGVTAHGLGNRHLQAQFFDDDEYGQAVMVVQYDHTVEHFLEHSGVPYTREERVMPEAFRHAEHSH